MTIVISNVRALEAEQDGSIREIPIQSQDLVRLSGRILQFMQQNGTTAEIKVKGNTLRIPNIKVKNARGELVRVDRGRQIALASAISNRLHANNVKANIQVI